MVKAEKAAFTNGSWDELYTAKLDSGDAIWETGQKKGDIFVNMIGEISYSIGPRMLANVLQEFEIEGDLQKELAKRVFQLQELGDARFHITGGTGGGKMHIFLTTEFKNDLTEKYFWRRVRSFSYMNGGTINQMTRELEDGGVISKHVEVVWRIEDMTYDVVKALIERARKTSEDIWNEGGMSVS